MNILKKDFEKNLGELTLKIRNESKINGLTVGGQQKNPI